MKTITAALVAACLLIAGCGGTTKPVGPKQTVAFAHPCNPQDQTMGCVLRDQPKPANPGLQVSLSVHGVDFGWSSVSAAEASRLGARFGASYASLDASKNWTRSLVDSYHHAGLATVVVWETTASRALDGFAAGKVDAHLARSQADALGEPANRPIFFAVDFDTTPNPSEIDGYFQGVHSVLGDHAGAYGGITTIRELFDKHLIGYGWQTYAWSNGQWDTRAKLEQYLNGSSFDNDRAIAADYGQWPFAAPAPRVNHHYGRYPLTPRKVCGGCSERATVKRYDRLRALQSSGHHPHRAELARLRKDCGLLADRIERVATRHGVGVWGVSPQWSVYHRRQRWLGLRRREHGAIVPRPRS